jgi:hypothetical protein
MWTLVGIVAVVALAVTFGIWGRCTHRYATLQPPVRNAGPDRDHARWYCDRCGRTWDAGLESTTRPRVVFEGYDESKAVKAAVRAEALDKQRRRLATKRAGSSRGKPARPAHAHRPGPRPIEAVVGLDQRAVGYPEAAPRTFAAARRARD